MCNFCILFDFSMARTKVENGVATIEKAPEGIPFLERDWFRYCPMCGSILDGRSSKISAEFPKNLRRIRRARGLTQETLAKAIGMQRNAICAYEHGRRQPSLRKIEALCRLLDVNLQELI